MITKKLHSAAKKAQANAYSPYSGYKVGAALVDTRGKIYAGCNVENSTYGATVCAERNAIAAMVTDGGKKIREVAVITTKGWLPCGICRQVLLEFAQNPSKIKISIYKDSKLLSTQTLAALLPNAFSTKDL